MNLLYQYWYLFKDSLVSALVIPIQEEFVIDILLSFKSGNQYLLIAIAFLGSLVGASLNYLAGYILSKGREIVYSSQPLPRSRTEKLLQKYGYILLIFANFNLVGGMLTLFSGFFRLKPLICFLFILISYLIHYSKKLVI